MTDRSTRVCGSSCWRGMVVMGRPWGGNETASSISVKDGRTYGGSRRAAVPERAPRPVRLLRAQVGQDGEDPAVVVGSCGHGELGEDGGDVLLHAALADAQPVGDAL